MAVRDPEVSDLTIESLRLVVKAEMVLDELLVHQHKVADFLQRAARYTDEQQEGDRDGSD